MPEGKKAAVFAPYEPFDPDKFATKVKSLMEGIGPDVFASQHARELDQMARGTGLQYDCVDCKADISRMQEEAKAEEQT